MSHSLQAVIRQWELSLKCRPQNCLNDDAAAAHTVNNAVVTRDLSKCAFVKSYRQQQLFYVSVRACFCDAYVPWAPADIYLKEVGANNRGTLAKRDQKISKIMFELFFIV